VFREEFNNGVSFMSNLSQLPTVTPQTWHHIDMAFDLAAKTRTFAVDSTTLVSGPASFPVAPGTLSVDAGLDFLTGNSPGESFFVDNVVVFLTP
jgi:hypothetical protein